VYKRHKITEVKWIDRNSNPADNIIKSKLLGALKTLIDINKVNLVVQEWVEHTGVDNSNSNKAKGTSPE
jgi:hypothetical protein